VLLGRDGREGQFGEGLGDAHDGFQLAHGDGDGGARVGFELGCVDLFADGDEVGGEFFGGCVGEARGAPAVGGVVSGGLGGRGIRGAYDRQ
jgi:hypothetical protein